MADAATVAHPCAMCAQHDDHPKHIFVLDVKTGEEARRHMDCCASVGCGLCAWQIKDAAGAKGDALRQHLVTKDQLAAQAAQAALPPAGGAA